MADRIGVIRKGEIILVEEKDTLMRKLGRKQLTLQLKAPLEALPSGLNGNVELGKNGLTLLYTFDTQSGDTGIAGLLRKLGELGIEWSDLQTSESSLEDIFVSLVRA
jgi:ABC-2 type transport system ATP-binding protein